MWQERLRRLNVPAAAKLVRALSPENPLGYVNTAGRNNAGTLTRWVEDQKRRHPDKVLLVRVGDFYEAYGVDALLLVEHCGLNPMAQKARAGCPIPNVQQTLNGLTSAGFAVNVYEEHPHELMGGTKLKATRRLICAHRVCSRPICVPLSRLLLRSRKLRQVLHPALRAAVSRPLKH